MPALLNAQNQNASDSFPLAQPLVVAVAEAEAALAGDILWSLHQFAARRAAYTLYHDYMNGDHRLTFATKGYREAFRALLEGLRCNICPRVVHALTDRLRIVGFEPHDSHGDGQSAGDVDAQVQAARIIWQDARLDRHANQVHTEAVACGDAYLLIWPDPLDPTVPRFYPQRADQLVVRYDEERPNVPTLAAKLWRVGKRYRLTLYYADRTEKYETRADGELVPEQAEAFAPRRVSGEAWPVRHDYGRVPVFHFAFEGGIGETGRAELRDIVPLQDALNKTLADLIVASEFGAFPMRYGIGITDDDEAVQVGIDRLMTVANPEAKLGQFDAAKLENYTETMNHFFRLAAQIKGIPLHTLLMSGDFPSGEALKTAEAPLISRVEDTQTDFGDVWEDALAFAIHVAGGPDAAHLTALWQPAASRVEGEHVLNVAIKRERIGVSWKQAMRELDYSEDEIAAMETEREAEREDAMVALDDALNRGYGAEDGAAAGGA